MILTLYSAFFFHFFLSFSSALCLHVCFPFHEKLVYRQFLDPSATSTITSLFSNFPKFYARLQFNNANVYTPDLSRFHLYLSLSFFSGFFDYFFLFLYAFFLSLFIPFLFEWYSQNVFISSNVDRLMRRENQTQQRNK